MKKVSSFLLLMVLSISFGFANLTTNLDLYLPFDGNAMDVTAGSHDGVLVGNVTLTVDRTGKSNSAYSFDGTNGYIRVNGFSQLNSAEYAVSLWFKANDLSGVQSLFFHGEDNADLSNLYSFLNEDDLITGFEPSTSLHIRASSGSILQVNKWYHLLYQRKSNGNLELYLDGKLIRSTSSSESPAAVSSRIYIGASRNYDGGSATITNFFNGNIDDVKFYSRSLEPTEIAATYGVVPNVPAISNIGILLLAGFMVSAGGVFVYLKKV